MTLPAGKRPSERVLRPDATTVAFLGRTVDAGIVAVGLWIPQLALGEPWETHWTAAAGISVLAFLALASMTGLHRGVRRRSASDDSAVFLTTWLGVISLLLTTAFLSKSTELYSRRVCLFWFVAVPVLASCWRFLFLYRLQFLRTTRTRRVAIIGATVSGADLAERLVAPAMGSELIGMFDDREKARLDPKVLERVSIQGDVPELVALAKKGSVEAIYIALPMRAERRIKELVRELADTTASVYVVTDLFVFDLMQARWSSVGDIPVVNVFDTPFSGLGGWVKRAEDIFLSTIILTIIFVPMLFIALLVKVTSKGPVFFRQTRYGLNGRPIRVLKFRTMTTMDNGAHVMQATKNDPRITPIGRFLRRTSLDELPQFINVALGDMSVVGPRPHAVAHNELYRGKIRGYMLRHKVKPGITGWAQVNGWRGETEVVEKMEQRVEHDLYYIDNWSLFWDLKIVVLTIFGRNVRSSAY